MRSACGLLLATLGAACFAAGPPPPAPASPGQLVVEAPRVCVIRDGALEMIPIRIDAATGDTTTLDGVPFSSAVPPSGEYAAGAEWYARNEVIEFGGFRYLKYGLAREISAGELARVGEYRGIGVFTDSIGTPPSDFIYIPERPGCVFQPYELPHRRN